MKILIFNNRGTVSIEAVVVGVIMIFILYLLSQVVFLLLSGSEILVSADADIMEKFSKVKTPCLEEYANDKFEGGSYGLVTPDIYVGFGADTKKFKISRYVKFLDGEICN